MNDECSWTEVLSEDWSGPLRLRVRGRSMWPTLRPGDQVTVESAATDHLQRGDWVLLQGREALFLHRFLGFTREGLLLTKGDGHRAPDSPWSPDALRGRAVAVSREGRTIPVSPSSPRERARTIAHRLMAAAWTFLHRTGLLIFLLLGVSVISVAAAVVLVSFEATPQDNFILITWVTASETNMAGFHVQRAPYVTPIITDCEVIPDIGRINTAIIQTEADIAGATYTYTDTNAVAGSTYYYCLEAVETNGVREFHGPITATLPLPPTSEPPPPPPPVTPSPSPSPTPTPTPPTGTPPTSTPTQTPTPTVSSSGDETPTETLTPSPTHASTAKSPSATATLVPEPEHASLESTATPESTLTSLLTESTSAPIAQATSAAPTTSGRHQPSPSPESTLASLTRITTKQKPFFPWALILLLIVAASFLILLGGWGIWRMRDKK